MQPRRAAAGPDKQADIRPWLDRTLQRGTAPGFAGSSSVGLLPSPAPQEEAPTVSSRIELPAATVLCREGDPRGSAFRVERGKIEPISGSDAAAIALGRLGPGDPLGEMPVMDGELRTATARAITGCVLTPLARGQLSERIEAAAPVVRAMLRGQLQRNRSALQRPRGLPGRASNGAADRGLTRRGADDAVATNRLESRLRTALDRGALAVPCQPVLEIATANIAEDQALVRWSKPDFAPLVPGAFILIAEDTSPIVPVARHAFA